VIEVLISFSAQDRDAMRRLPRELVWNGARRPLWPTVVG
jgi:hypothetical protein